MSNEKSARKFLKREKENSFITGRGNCFAKPKRKKKMAYLEEQSGFIWDKVFEYSLKNVKYDYVLFCILCEA